MSSKVYTQHCSCTGHAQVMGLEEGHQDAPSHPGMVRKTLMRRSDQVNSALPSTQQARCTVCKLKLILHANLNAYGSLHPLQPGLHR
eukprot:838954-Pelagomonas_calceolata.AAC.1